MKPKNALALKGDLDDLIRVYEEERSSRAYYYDLRKQFYSGERKATVGKGHELIRSMFCASIVDKLSKYVGTNAPEVNFKPKDITNGEDAAGAQVVELAFAEILRSSDWKELFNQANYGGSWAGDAFLSERVVDNFPKFYHIKRPGNVLIGWRTDNFDEIDYWAYTYKLSKVQAKMQFKGDKDLVGKNYTPQLMDPDLYTSTTSSLDQKMKEQIDKNGQRNYVQVIDMHIFIDVNDEIKAGDAVTLINGTPYEIRKGGARNLYHFKANEYLDMPTGISDFENVAETVLKYDKKLSEEADVVTDKAYHTYITTERNTDKLKASLKPGSTQILKLIDSNSKFDVLKKDSNSYNSEPLINNLLNIVRTASGVQELGQDQISPNISGKALSMMFQGVIQKVTDKRKRWEKLIEKMAISAMETIGDMEEEGIKMRDIAFDDRGNFKYNVEVIWPDVLETDKATRITTIQAMRQGATPLISDYTAMQMAGIPDPMQEKKRVEQEMAEKMKYQQALMGTEMQPSTPEAPILTESQNQEGDSGMPSMQGMSGSAQNSVSPEGNMNMQLSQGRM